MITLGASTLAFHNFPIEEALARIRGLGFDRTDIAMLPGFCDHFDPLRATADARAAFVGLIRDSGLIITTLNVGCGSFHDPATCQDQVGLTRRALELARDLGCYAITAPVGSRVRADEWVERARFGASWIADLADVAADVGIHLTLEAPHVDSFVETTPQVLDYLEIIGDPRVGVTLDPSHIQARSGDVTGYIRALWARIGHVHLRDARSGNILVRPGLGEVDFWAMLRDLEATGYSGAAAFELLYATGLSAEELEEELRQSRAHIEQALPRGPREANA